MNDFTTPIGDQDRRDQHDPPQKYGDLLDKGGMEPEMSAPTLANDAGFVEGMFLFLKERHPEHALAIDDALTRFGRVRDRITVQWLDEQIEAARQWVKAGDDYYAGQVDAFNEVRKQLARPDAKPGQPAVDDA